MDIFVCDKVAIEDKVLFQSWLVIMLKRFFIMYLRIIYIYLFLNPCKNPLDILEANSMNTYSVFVTDTNV